MGGLITAGVVLIDGSCSQQTTVLFRAVSTQGITQFSSCIHIPEYYTYFYISSLIGA